MFIPAGLKRLIGAGFIAQIIAAIGYPIISRLFDPTSFGVFSVYANLVGLIAIVVCGRLDAAIAFQNNRNTVAALAFGGIGFSIIISAIASTLLMFNIVRQWFYDFGIDSVVILIFIPISVLLFGIVQVVQSLALYERLYTDIGKSRVVQSTAQLIIQILSGLGKLGAIGLALGFMAGQVLGYGVTLIKLKSVFLPVFKKLTKRRVWAVLKSKQKFSLHSIPSSLLLAATPMLPPIILMKFRGAESAGLFYLTAQLLSQSLSVMRRGLAQYIQGEGRFLDKERYLRGLNKMRFYITGSLLVIIPFWILLFFFKENAFILVLGNKWGGAGDFVLALLPMYLLDVVGYAYTQILVVKEQYRLQLIIDTTRAIVVLGGLILFLFFGQETINCIIWHSVSMSVFYLVIIYYGHRQIVST